MSTSQIKKNAVSVSISYTSWRRAHPLQIVALGHKYEHFYPNSGIRAQIRTFLSTWYFCQHQIKQGQINTRSLITLLMYFLYLAKTRHFFFLTRVYTPVQFCMCGNHKKASSEWPIEAAARQRQHCQLQTTKPSPAPVVSHKVSLKHAAFIPRSWKVESKEGAHALTPQLVPEPHIKNSAHPETKSQLPLTRAAKEG